jgi:hypothetical protein
MEKVEMEKMNLNDASFPFWDAVPCNCPKGIHSLAQGIVLGNRISDLGGTVPLLIRALPILRAAIRKAKIAEADLKQRGKKLVKELYRERRKG